MTRSLLTRTSAFVLLGVALTIPLSQAKGQTSCATSGGQQQYLRGAVRKMMNSTNAAVIAERTRMQIPLVNDTTKVVWEASASNCNKIRNAMIAHLAANSSTRPVGTQIYAVKVGNNYVVQDSYADSTSEWTRTVVLSKQFKVLATGIQ